MFQEFHSFRTG